MATGKIPMCVVIAEITCDISNNWIGRIKMGKCKCCGFRFIGKPDRYCGNCAYHFDFIDKYRELSVFELKALPERIPIRTAICAVYQKGETNKGYLAHFTMTNKDVEIAFFQKYEQNPFVKKTWKFKENPRVIIPYDDLSIGKGAENGRLIYIYGSPTYGEFRTDFSVNGSVSLKYNLNSEMSAQCAKFIAAETPKVTKTPCPTTAVPITDDELPRQKPVRPAAKFCRYCGSKLEDGDIYCVECGEKL